MDEGGQERSQNAHCGEGNAHTVNDEGPSEVLPDDPTRTSRGMALCLESLELPMRYVPRLVEQ